MNEPIIKADNLVHSYAFEGSKRRSLDDLSLSVAQGEYVAVLGRNGSGKTTLGRHLNALLELQGGSLSVAYLDVRNRKNLWKIREKAGMVFQNPENQFVSSVVEEDLSFGPRNFGVPEEEIEIRIQDALHKVGLDGFESRSPHLLSGGQKQRLAIAGVLAANPDILICDEITSMLDPDGRASVLGVLEDLRQMGKTIFLITHYIEEALQADRVMVLSQGTLAAEGMPRDILTNRDVLGQAGLMPPFAVRIYYELLDRGCRLPFCPLTEDELVEALCQLS